MCHHSLTKLLLFYVIRRLSCPIVTDVNKPWFDTSKFKRIVQPKTMILSISVSIMICTNVVCVTKKTCVTCFSLEYKRRYLKNDKLFQNFTLQNVRSSDAQIIFFSIIKQIFRFRYQLSISFFFKQIYVVYLLYNRPNWPETKHICSLLKLEATTEFKYATHVTQAVVF